MNIKIRGNNNQVALNGNINNIMIPIYKQEPVNNKELATKNIFSNKILELIHQINKYESDFGIEELAYILDLNSVSELTIYFNENKEPNYNFQDEIANKLNISKKWLKFSRGNIFDGECIKTLWIRDLYDILKKDKFENLYLLISDSEFREVLLLIEKKRYIYQKYYKTVALHSNIGESGKSRLLDFYEFIKKVNCDTEIYLKTTEFLIPERIFKSIVCGDLYPGAIIKERECVTYMCEDLLDLTHKYFKNDEYIKMYGEFFLKCQQFILEKKRAKKVY